MSGWYSLPLWSRLVIVFSSLGAIVPFALMVPIAIGIIDRALDPRILGRILIKGTSNKSEVVEVLNEHIPPGTEWDSL